MTASVKGEARIGEHVLKFGINQLCDIEAAFEGKSAVEVFQGMGDNPSMTTLRQIFAIGLGVEQVEAGAIIDDVGFSAATAALGQAFEAAFPDAKGDAPPRKAARRTTG